jgi:hypothetical protein
MHLDDLFAARARDIPAALYGPAPAHGLKRISFDYGLADPALFPRDDLLAAAAAVLDQEGWVIRVSMISKIQKPPHTLFRIVLR